MIIMLMLPCKPSFKIVIFTFFEFFFRWETLDSFMQHDVQELCRVVR